VKKNSSNYFGRGLNCSSAIPRRDEMDTGGEKSDNDIMMESTTSDSGLGSSSETSSLNNKSANNFPERERRESTSSQASNPSDVMMMPPSPVSREQLHKRIESLQQQNRVLKCELETYKLRVKSLQEENRSLRQSSVNIQAKAEQEEEFISNTLLKKIQALKKEKENLALNYEQEEECLTNDLSRKLNQLRQEKVQLEHTLEQEQECLVNKLMRRIEKLESETTAKQTSLETLRREKVELENTLEQEQEALVNKLWKRMDQLETEKRSLQMKMDPDVAASVSVAVASTVPTLAPPGSKGNSLDTAANLANNIRALKAECARLKHTLATAKGEHEAKMAEFVREEKEIKEENLRLQRRLQLEMERREALCRHLSESESSLEMEEERVYNELSHASVALAPTPGATPTGPGHAHAVQVHRTRTVSSPVPVVGGLNVSGPSPQSAASIPSTSRPLSPGLNYGDGIQRRESGHTPLFTPPPMIHHGRVHSLTTPPGAGLVVGVPSPSPPPPTVLPPSGARHGRGPVPPVTTPHIPPTTKNS